MVAIADKDYGSLLMQLRQVAVIVNRRTEPLRTRRSANPGISGVTSHVVSTNDNDGLLTNNCESLQPRIARMPRQRFVRVIQVCIFNSQSVTPIMRILDDDFCEV